MCMRRSMVAWPYIQGHRGSTFVIVIPGEVVENRCALESILQDITQLHGLGIRLVIVPGTHIQIDKLLNESHSLPSCGPELHRIPSWKEMYEGGSANTLPSRPPHNYPSPVEFHLFFLYLRLFVKFLTPMLWFSLRWSDPGA